MSKPMTNHNERLDEILQQNIQFEYIGSFPEAAHRREDIVHINGNVYKFNFTEAKQALTSLIKELVDEAKPSKKTDTRGATQNPNNAFYHTKKAQGYNEAIDQFEQNLLKALEEV